MGHLLKILFFLGIFVLFLHPIDSDGDFFQHVNIGRYVLEKNSLPYTDNLTFTAAGKPYLGYSWGTGVIFYLLYKYLGPIGVNLFVAGIATLTAFILFRFLQIITKSDKITFLTLALTLPVIATRFPSRPEIMTYLFVAALLLVNELRHKSGRLSFFFPFIILLWANMYSVSVLVGLGLLSLFVIQQWFIDKRCFLKDEKFFYLSVLACFPIAFLNGYGASALLYVLRVRELTEFHGDWASIDRILTNAPAGDLLVYQYRLLIFFLYISFFILLTAISYKTVLHNTLFAVLSLGLIVTFVAARQIPLAVFLSMPFLAILLSQLNRSRKFIFSLSLIVCAFSLFILIRNDPPKTGEDTETFPKTMISFMNKHQLEGNVFNTQRIGSFISYHLYPQIKVFSDTRDDLFVNTTVLQEMGRIFYSQKRMAQLLDSYKIDIVIADLTEGGSYPFLLKDGWIPVYNDSLYLILVPVETAKEKGLKSVKWM